MINIVTSFFRRIFTESKFPRRTSGKMDKRVEDVYNVKVMNSEVDDKKVVVLDPREPMNKEDK